MNSAHGEFGPNLEVGNRFDLIVLMFYFQNVYFSYDFNNHGIDYE